MQNPYRSPGTILKGVAARISGDKSAFYQCAFVGLQDTLWDDGGRHYFRNCAIAGGIDFIFGAGQSHYEVYIYISCFIIIIIIFHFDSMQRCTIALQQFMTQEIGVGYITAQGRGSFQETNGFVFKSCNIAGNGRAFLGRPWRDYARVLFYNTQMSKGVDPQGWALSEERGRA